MKKLFLAFAVMTITSTAVNAQKTSMANPTTFSIGVEASVPIGIFHDAGYNFGIGGSAQVEHKVSTDMGLTLNAGYLYYSNKNTIPYKYHFSVIPVLAGVKYWFSPKVYVHGQLGAAFNSTKVNNNSTNQTITSTGFAYSPGVGFMISNNIDLLIKYFGNSVGKDSNSGIAGGTFNSFGARLAYNFGG
jgi:opacity protein-like surface antigen